MRKKLHARFVRHWVGQLRLRQQLWQLRFIRVLGLRLFRFNVQRW
jgi:hypothetical protein